MIRRENIHHCSLAGKAPNGDHNSTDLQAEGRKHASFDDLLRLQGQNFVVVAEEFGTVRGDFGSDCTAIFHLSFPNFLYDLSQTIPICLGFPCYKALWHGPHLKKHGFIWKC